MTDEYRTFARTYDLEFGKLEGDIPFYVEYAKAAGGPVLELAVGTGRVAIPIARAGVPVLGVDASEAMLAVLKAKADREPDLPLLYLPGDMRNFDATEHGPFKMAYCPARAFIHLLEPEDQLATLLNLRRHLTDDGLFLGNVFFPSVSVLHRRQNEGPAHELTHEYVDPDSGNRVLVYDLSRPNTRTQRIDTIFRADEVDADGQVVRSTMRRLRLTWFWPRELTHLFARAGFEIIERFGDFQKTPFSSGGGELIWVARKMS